MRKPIEELRKLNTKNLLRYYKAERKRFYGVGYWCSCGCGEMTWEVQSSQRSVEQEYEEHKAYLESIKKELDSREHVY